MAEIAEHASSRVAPRPSPWSELFRKEDWWAIWIGLGLIAVAIALFANGSSIKWLAVAPQKWSQLADIPVRPRHLEEAPKSAVTTANGFVARGWENGIAAGKGILQFIRPARMVKEMRRDKRDVDIA